MSRNIRKFEGIKKCQIITNKRRKISKNTKKISENIENYHKILGNKC